MITTEQIKELRDKTGISVMQCRKALEEAAGDMEKAMAILRANSSAIAEKKSERTLKSGVIASYVHSSGSVGALLELNCESDFVAKNPEFKQLAYDIAMHITAAAPEYLDGKDVADATNPEIKEKILLEQAYIKDGSMTIANLITSFVQKFGERIEIGGFKRMSVLGQ